MFLYTLRHPDNVCGLIGVATGADFTQRVWKSLSKEQRVEVQRSGVYNMHSEYCSDPIPLSMELFRDGGKYSILDMPGTMFVYISVAECECVRLEKVLGSNPSFNNSKLKGREPEWSNPK